MKSAKRKTIMIDGVRYYAERPHDCRKCFFWKNRKVGCTLGSENCYYLAEVIEREIGMSDSGKNELKKAPANIPETCPQEATADTSSDTPMLTMRIGNMTFLVGIHFNKDSKETMEDKIHRMIRRDIETGNF